MRLQGRVAAITGGALGIGRATARLFAAEGAAVVLGDVQVEAAEAVAKEIVEAGGRALAVGVDVGDAGQVQAFVDRAVAELGRLDVMFANAPSPWTVATWPAASGRARGAGGDHAPLDALRGLHRAGALRAGRHAGRRYPNRRLAETVDTAVALAQATDALGYETLWLAEHHFQHEGLAFTSTAAA